MSDGMPDDKISMLDELNRIERQLSSIGDSIYELSIRKKMLRHRAADLQYALSERK